MKKRIILLSGLLLIVISVFAQPERIGLGLAFTTAKEFYEGETGNPGFMAKTWISVDKRKAMFIVPSFMVFNKLSYKHTAYISDTYMFQADLDYQITVFHENTLKIVALAGANGSYLKQHNYSPDAWFIDGLVLDTTTMGFGPNIGAGLEMRMGPTWDFIVNAKYSFTGLHLGNTAADEAFLVAPLGGFMIQVQAVYYFVNRGRGYSKR